MPARFDDLHLALGDSARLIHGPKGDQYTQDLAGLETHWPALVIETSSEEACSQTLAWASRHECKIAIRGAGQSCNGQTLSDGIVLSILPSPGIIEAGEDGRIQLGGGNLWLDIEGALCGSAWSIPVHTANLSTSVAGTLSNCGFGARSIKRGCQIDHVHDYRLVLPDGDVRTISPGDAMFDLGLGSLGQAGVISQVTLNLAPRSNTCHVHRQVWHTREEMMRALSALSTLPSSTRPDCFYSFLDRGQLEGRAAYGVYGYETGNPQPVPACDHYVTENFDLDLHNDVAAWLRAYDGHHFLLSDYVFDFDGFARFFNETLTNDLPDFLTAAYILLSAPPPNKSSSSAFDPRAGRNEMSYGLGLYCMVPKGSDLEPVLAFLTRASDRCDRLSGKSLLYGASAYASSRSRKHDLPAVERLGKLQGARPGFNGAWRNRF